jgi:uncharacterized protein (DUF362 family)
MTRVFIDHLDEGYDQIVLKAFEFLGSSSVILPQSRVCIKPNLTYPQFRKGVMTNPEALEAVIVYLKNFTDQIVICESDSGGYNPFSMDEVFATTGITEFAKRYGVRIVNMSAMPSKDIAFRWHLRTFRVPLPTLLLEDTDLFVTMPVPKVHLNTVVSIALKNQWGVIQQPSLRLKLHPYFKEVIYRVNKALPRTIAIVDGRYGLTRSGPMRGDVLDTNWLLAADNPFVCDRVVTELMGLDYRRIPYLRHILHQEHVTSLDNVEFNCDYRPFVSHDFYLERAWTDYPGVMTFNSRALAYVGYESILAKPLHWLLYRFREPFY